LFHFLSDITNEILIWKLDGTGRSFSCGLCVILWAIIPWNIGAGI